MNVVISIATFGPIASYRRQRRDLSILPADYGSSESFLLHVAVAGNDELYSFVIDKLTEREEVADVRTSVVYEHVRPQMIEP